MKRYLLLIIILLNSLNSNAQEIGLDQRIDEAFQPISDIFSKYVFYPVS
jgi:AGCS family alanine or glycine:cation symporter